MKTLQTDFILPKKEVTEEEYFYFLEVLPPERMAKNAFLVGEPVTHEKGKALFDLYFERDGKFYNGGLDTVDTFDAFLID